RSPRTRPGSTAIGPSAPEPRSCGWQWGAFPDRSPWPRSTRRSGWHAATRHCRRASGPAPRRPRCSRRCWAGSRRSAPPRAPPPPPPPPRAGGARRAAAAEIAPADRTPEVARQLTAARIALASSKRDEWPVDALALLVENHGAQDRTVVEAADQIVARLVE